MENLSAKNETLFQRIKKLVSVERRIGVEILECLYLIEQRKAYAELKYDGLFTYCVKEVGFTDSQAFQRIQAMRTLKEIPELKPMIESGSLSVCSVAKVQTHFRRERKSGTVRSAPEKLELFQTMENRTSREVEAKLAEVRGEKLKVKIVLELDGELEALWTEVKNLAAHRSGGDESEVLRLLAKDWLERNDPRRKAERVAIAKDAEKSARSSESRVKPDSPIHEYSKTPSEKDPVSGVGVDRSSPPTTRRSVSTAFKVTGRRSHSQPTRYISAPVRREIWKRDQGKCTSCGSKYAIEFDHRRPFALGGESSAENLRLLCRSCNTFEAVRVFGVRKDVIASKHG